jgi:maltooligosyltrehalose trehalohydrolase
VGCDTAIPVFLRFEGELADAVRKGRRAEFASFPEFHDPEQRDRIPDPLAESTFASVKLDWSALDHSRVAHYQALIAARRKFIVPLLPAITHGGSAECYGSEVVQVRWQAGRLVLVLAANLSNRRVDFPEPVGRTIWSEGDTIPGLGPWSVRWSLA